MFNWNWPSGSWKKDENVKSLRQQQQKTNSDQKSSLKPSAYVSYKNRHFLTNKHLWAKINEQMITCINHIV